MKVYSHIVDRKFEGEHLKKGSKRRTVVSFPFQKKTNVACYYESYPVQQFGGTQASYWVSLLIVRFDTSKLRLSELVASVN